MKIGDSMRRELTRLTFLKLSGAGLAGATLLGGTGYDRSAGEFVTEAAAAAALDTARCRTGEPWSNYTETLSLVPHSTCTPESLADVVAIISEAEAANKRVHAFGSKWSFSDCAVTNDYVIDTKRLNQELQTEDRLIPALRPGQSPLLYHVEAGITIRDLYLNLDRLGLALETMGGASGQSLAGAISTGTHGGDKTRKTSGGDEPMPPLADSVLAIHLVGVGGTQYWIEPSPGITDPARLKARVVPDVDRQNIIYDDATFNACLVSLGCMGVIYSVVLRVRKPYDLVETTLGTTWGAFKRSAPAYLNDPNNRFLQIVLNPYTTRNHDNYCLLTTRSEADVTVARERPDTTHATVHTVISMLRTMEFVNPGSIFTLLSHGALNGIHDPNVPFERKMRNLVQGVLTYTPENRWILIDFYSAFMNAQAPPGTFQGSSYSVMDLGYHKEWAASRPGYSVELHFQSMDGNGRLPFADFIDALIATVNAATATFFAGRIAIRFTGPTRASLGMQQWGQTCTVEISTVQDVRGLKELLTELFRLGFNRGALPHWGQQLDLGLGVQGHGSLYRQYAQWRRVYAKMSDNFTTQTFETELSSRWNLTTPTQGPFRVVRAGSGYGIGGYDLWSPNDRAFAFDYNSSGKADHLVLYRPGYGTIYILENNGGTFTPVLLEGSGIGGYDLQSPNDQAFAFDYNSSGKADHLVLYRPGYGTIWILRNDGGTFTPVYAEGSPGNGIGGYDLWSANDRAFAFDYNSSGKLDHLALYRPGTGTIWILG